MAVIMYESYYGVSSLGSDYLMHHGIKGQKWGIRRFQNPDGSLTPAGVQRYGTVENFERSRAERKARTDARRQKIGSIAKGAIKGVGSAAKKAAVTAAEIRGAEKGAYDRALYEKEQGSKKSGSKKDRTDKGKGRRGLSDKTKARIKKGAKVAAGVAAAGALAYGAYKMSSSSDAKAAKRLLAIKKLSDEDLLSKIGRLEKEKKLIDLTDEINNYGRQSSKARRIMAAAGETAVKSVVTAGTVWGAKKMIQHSLNAAGADGDRIIKEMYPKKK